MDVSSLEGHVPMPESMEQLKLLLMRWNALKNQGANENTHAEFRQINNTLTQIAAVQKTYNERLQKLNSARKPAAGENNDLTRAQVQAFKLLSRNVDLPESLQLALKQGLPSSTRKQNGQTEKPNGVSAERELEYDTFDARERQAKVDLTGVDEKNTSVGGVSETIIRNRLTHRMAELETLPSNLGSFKIGEIEPVGSDEVPKSLDDLKLKALIELKGLRLLTKQKALRQQIVVKMADSPELKKIKNRMNYRLQKKQSKQELMLTEELEKKQREARERKEYDRKVEKFRQISDQSMRMADTYRFSNSRAQMMGKVVNAVHKDIDKEESRRSERTAKQRLQALRANDEEAYIKLLDQTKDTRITHLLKQTNSFLKSLSAAVRVQQQDSEQQEEEGELEQDEDVEEEDKDYYAVAHRIHEKVEKQPGILVGGSLKEYQLRGLEWMVSLYNNNLNGILADEMGLGKTIQSISLIGHLIEFKKQPGPYLVIVPLSTLTNWNLEFEKWAPSIRRVVYKGNPQQRKAQQAVIRTGDFQVLLTTYEYVIKDRFLLSKIKWTHMIIDEGHRMKNTSSKLSQTLTSYYSSRHRLILTGTPLQNNLPELWALLNFVLPKIFNSVKTFDEWFNTPFANTGGQDKMELTEEETLLIIRRLHKVLRPFLLRRLKKDVEKDLPDKVEKVIKCKMSALQSKLYDQMLRHGVLYVGGTAAVSTNGKVASSIKGLNNKVMQLRKICNHPFVFEEVETAISPSPYTTDELWRVAGKFELLDRILPKFKATGHRVLIFFQMTQVMDIMEDYLRFKGMQYLRLDGGTKADERSDMLKLFNAEDSPYFAFLLSTRAGGLGLNLQSADTVIIYDTDWNPHQDLQAQDRAHRIGQTKEVRILRLISSNTVEEDILGRAQNKLEIDGKVIQAGKFDNKSTNEEQEAFLRNLLESEESKRRGGGDDDDMTDEDLNDILARNDNELITFSKLDNERVQHGGYGKNNDKGRLFSVEELPEDYQQDIEVHMEPEKDLILGRGARERKSIMYDDGLTEEQWLDAVDDDDDTIEGAIERKQARKARRDAKKLQIEDGDAMEPPVVEPAEELAPVQEAEPVQSEPDNEVKAGKRKRGRSARMSTGLEEPEDGAPPTKRKARKSKTADSLEPEDRNALVERANQMIDAFTSVKDEDGRDRSELFLQLPSKKMYPDYYQLIKSPVALEMIKKRVKKNEYSSLEQVKADFDVMLANAQEYNEQGSMVYDDATALGEAVNSTYGSVSKPAKSKTKIKLKMSN